MEVCDEQEVGKSVSERDGWRAKNLMSGLRGPSLSLAGSTPASFVSN